ncbi:MAG: helix-turn-helix domain-containing protein [Tannerellaceae bacterium]|nr:helix-turn-helix domain-containing protein [Tannerellaceae bacterium]
MSFPAYINSLRLDEALTLMNEYPELPMEVIAEKAGFGSSRSFYRHFYKRFGISPTAYRHKKIK